MASEFHWKAVHIGQSPAVDEDGSIRQAKISDITSNGKMLPSTEESAEAYKVDPLDLTCNTQSTTGGSPAITVGGGSSTPLADGCDVREATAGNSSSVEAASITTGEDAHRCDMCGKTFAVPARLTRHYRTHTGERPFVCEVCGKSFSVKENLSVHRRIHTKEKPYRCHHCGRGFEHSGKLHRHMRIHTGERPHQCVDCGKTFIQSGQLVIHMRSHTGEKPYVCKVCSKGFTCSKQLKVHSRTHTGERPYACDVCGKTFAYNHVLKLHQMAHLGERLYKCTICKETYSSKKALESHIKSHAPSNRASPVPSTSRASNEQPIRVGRSVTSGGTYFERSISANSTGTPVELSSNSSPSSVESSRSSASDTDVISGAIGAGDLMRPALSWSTNASLSTTLLDSNLTQHHQQLQPTSQQQAGGVAYPPFTPTVHSLSRNMVPNASGFHQLGQDYSTFLRPMPPLVPVSIPPTKATHSITHSSLHTGPVELTAKVPSRSIGLSATRDSLTVISNTESCPQSNVPPRKSSRFRHSGSDSPAHSPPPVAPHSPSKSNVDDNKTPEKSIGPEVVRSTSVIRFAHRPCSTSTPPSSH